MTSGASPNRRGLADGQAMTNYQQFIAVASENAATLVAAIIARLL